LVPAFFFPTASHVTLHDTVVLHKSLMHWRLTFLIVLSLVSNGLLKRFRRCLQEMAPPQQFVSHQRGVRWWENN
jgi:hypothetical protein